MPISIGFHDVVTDWSAARPIAPGHTTLYTLDREQLRACLQAIHRRAGASSVSLVDQIGESDNGVRITVDDGASSSFSYVAPELERLGWRGHFFITTDWIGRDGFMSVAEIRELHQRGHRLGSHSCSHPKRMSDLRDDELKREWRESAERLSDVVGSRITLASVPGGFYSERVAAAAAEAGIRVLFTSEPTVRTQIVNGCRILGRYTVRHRTAAEVVASIAAGERPYRWRQTAAWIAMKSLKRVMGDWYLPLRRVLLGARP